MTTSGNCYANPEAPLQMQHLYSVTLETEYEYVKPTIDIYVIVPDAIIAEPIDPLGYLRNKLVQKGFNVTPLVWPIRLFVVSKEYMTIRHQEYPFNVTIETKNEYVKLTINACGTDVRVAADSALRMLIETRREGIGRGFPVAPLKPAIREAINNGTN